MTWEQLMKEEYGYEPITTFWMDFSIAERFGHDAIRNTYDRAMKEWHTNYKYLTELVLVLNHKIWQTYNTDEPTAKVYDELWRNAHEFACENLKDEELQYYYRTID